MLDPVLEGLMPADDDDNEEDWPEYVGQLAEDLDEFERHVWPVFERRGYSKEVALQVHLQRLNHHAVLETLEELLLEDED